MHVEMRKSLTQYAGIVCGIAMTLSDSSSAIMCAQCLYIGTYGLHIFIIGRCLPSNQLGYRSKTGDSANAS